MSTRCQIRVDDSEVYIYKHNDGYPHAVLDVLVPLVDAFMKDRGWDPEYMTARIVMAFGVAEQKHAAERLAEPALSDALKRYYSTPIFTGFGLDTELHGDIEYLYAVAADGTIRVYGCNGGYGTDLPEKPFVEIPLGTSVEDALALCKGGEKCSQ